MKEENRLKERGEVKHGAGKGCFVAVSGSANERETSQERRGPRRCS